MTEYIIADTSCLILFDNMCELQILKKVYGAITITPEVRRENKKELLMKFLPYRENFNSQG